MCACCCQCVCLAFVPFRDLHRRRPGGAICTVSQFVNPRCVLSFWIIQADWCTPAWIIDAPPTTPWFIDLWTGQFANRDFDFSAPDAYCIVGVLLWCSSPRAVAASNRHGKLPPRAALDVKWTRRLLATETRARISHVARARIVGGGGCSLWMNEVCCVCEWASCFLLGSAHTMMLLRSQTVISLVAWLTRRSRL